jgi:hypothetical protein
VAVTPFPFPDRELAARELESDPCFGKVPVTDRGKAIDLAWGKGERAAHLILGRYGGEADFRAIAGWSGLAIEREERDQVIAGRRYFSDYFTGERKIVLYLGSILLWSAQNALDESTAINLILGHEYYHFLETTEIGKTSELYKVPMIVLGRVTLGRTGIRALSEIGAHAFARTYFELTR